MTLALFFVGLILYVGITGFCMSLGHCAKVGDRMQARVPEKR